jgi:hypothetical protein
MSLVKSRLLIYTLLQIEICVRDIIFFIYVCFNIFLSKSFQKQEL